MTNVVVPNGGVSFESSRGYRGSVTVKGVRLRTTYFKTRRAALKALNVLRETMAISLSMNKSRRRR